MPYVTDTHSLIWHMTNDPKGYLVDLKELSAFDYQRRWHRQLACALLAIEEIQSEEIVL